MTIDSKCAVEYITRKKEFDYIKIVSDHYSVDYYLLCNFALDLYNYQRRTGLDKMGAKIMSLNNTADYAYKIYRRKLKEEKDANLDT